MHKLLVEMRAQKDAEALKSYLEKESAYEVLLSSGPRDTEQQIEHQKFQLLVLQSGHLSQFDIERIQAVRERGFVYPILTIADSIGNQPVTSWGEKYKAFFLEQPFEFKTFRGVVRKLLTSKTLLQPQHRRYRTHQVVQAETFVTGETYQTEMFNLSVGGAYFEFAKKPPMSIGDLLRLRISLSDVDKEHSVNGRIVWMTPKGHATGGYGLGVKFLKSTDIYRQLIDRV